MLFSILKGLPPLDCLLFRRPNSSLIPAASLQSVELTSEQLSICSETFLMTSLTSVSSSSSSSVWLTSDHPTIGTRSPYQTNAFFPFFSKEYSNKAMIIFTNHLNVPNVTIDSYFRRVTKGF